MFPEQNQSLGNLSVSENLPPAKNNTLVNIPLSSLKELFSYTINTTWSKKWRWIFLNIIPKLLGFLPLIFVFIIFAITTLLLNASTLKSIINIILGLMALVSIFIAMIYGGFWSSVAYIYYLQTGELLKKEILKQTRKKVWSLLVVNFLAAFASFGYLMIYFCLACLWIIFISQAVAGLIVLGIIFLILLVYSIIRAIKFSYAPLAYLVENLKGTQAIKRSKEVTRGYLWSIFKRSVVFAYFRMIIQMFFYILFFICGLIFSQSIIAGVILIVIVFLLNIFVGFLLEPFKKIYDYHIYSNLLHNKQENTAREVYSFGHKILTLLLAFILPLIFLGWGILINIVVPDSNKQLLSYAKYLPLVMSGSAKEDLSNTNGSLLDIEQSQIELIAQAQVVLDSLNQASEDEIAQVNEYLKTNYSNMPGNINHEPLKPFNTGDFHFFATLGGFDINQIDMLSQAKKEFLWNSFQIGMLQADLKNNNSTTNDTYPDTDNDGLTDTEEAYFNTDPQNPDTDNDGLKDIDETFFNTDPNNPDTDGDGYLDGQEVENGFDPAVPGDAKLN